MKKFNKEIKVAIELDFIAESLHSVMNPEFQHIDNVVEAIIGRLDANNDERGMGMLFNALTGFKNDIDFKPGDDVMCSDRVHAYWTEESRKKEVTVLREIGMAKVVSVNPYADDKLTIIYNRPTSDGKYTDTTRSVSHHTCKMSAKLKDILVP